MKMLTTDNKNSGETPIVKRIRRSLGMTQATVARTLGVSIRAIQSYEQGWRETPTSITLQMLVLASAYRAPELGAKACWEVTGCSATQKSQCPCRHTNGQLCWLVSGRMCGASAGSEAASLQSCLDCLVVGKLLSNDLQPAPYRES